MTGEVLEMTGRLAGEIARNQRALEPDFSEPRLRVVDPRDRPVRFHNLRAMAQSAAHAWQSFQDDKKDSLSKRLGAGTHAMLLGKPWEVFDKPAKKGKGRAPRNGEVWEEFKKEHAGKVILTPKERDHAEGLAAAIRANDLADLLMFSPGVVHEDTILWTQNGRARRTTPDVHAPAWVLELKTTMCAEPRRFRRDVRWMAYHAQIADQMNAVEAKTGRRPREAYIAAVEKVKPFVVEVYRLTPNDLMLGDRLCRNWLEQFQQAERRAGARAASLAAWSSYSSSVIDLDLPDDEFDLKPVTEDDEEEDADIPF